MFWWTDMNGPNISSSGAFHSVNTHVLSRNLRCVNANETQWCRFWCTNTLRMQFVRNSILRCCRCKMILHIAFGIYVFIFFVSMPFCRVKLRRQQGQKTQSQAFPNCWEAKGYVKHDYSPSFLAKNQTIDDIWSMKRKKTDLFPYVNRTCRLYLSKYVSKNSD